MTEPKAGEPTRKVKPSEVVEASRERPTYSPQTDIYERGDSIFVEAEMPGVDEKSISVDLDNNVVTIAGQAADHEVKEKSLLHQEYTSADYSRSFRLVVDIDEADIKANLKNGVLKLELPKAKKTLPKKIAVQAS